MAAHNSIPPFPSDLNRYDFGHWLSGFTDGEGCFLLHKQNDWRQKGKWSPGCLFTISLRTDDGGILELIQSYFGHGYLYHNRPASYQNGKPQSILQISKVTALPSVINHFDMFPLRAKKLRDYLIWREATQLFIDVFNRPRNNKRWGRISNWTAQERERWTFLFDHLREQRKFGAVPESVPKLPIISLPPSLFQESTDTDIEAHSQ